VLVFQFAPSKFFEEMKTLEQGTQEGTAADRIYLWNIGFRMFYDRPFLGVGPLNYPYYFKSYEQGKLYDNNYQYRFAHSTPVQWLAEMGFVGITILFALHIYLFNNWRLYDIHKNHGKNLGEEVDLSLFLFLTNACAISILSFWCGAFFLSVMFYPFFWVLIFFSESWKNIFNSHH
jgi:O-antigen ligase